MRANPFHFSMLSHPGRVRNGNEDACAAAPDEGAFVVCDGMGGAAAGEVASRIAAEAWLEALHTSASVSGVGALAPPDRVAAAVKAANHAVFRHARSAPGLRGMGTTLVGVLLVEAPDATQYGLVLGHVGDSRCYRWRDGVLEQLTQDHSLVEEQVRRGELTPGEAVHHPMRNIITRAIGAEAVVQPDIVRLEPRAGDLYLLASDGLTRELNDASIARLLRAGTAGEEAPGEKAALKSLCQILVDAANAAGGGDNITVLLLAIP